MPVNDDYFYYDDGSGYPYDEYEYDEDDDDYEYEADDDDYEYEAEVFCDEKGCLFEASDACQCCGKPLCVMHSEIGAGFCRECPTQEWIEEQDNMR